MLGALVGTIGSYKAVRRSRPAEWERREGKGWGDKPMEKDTDRSTDCAEQDKMKPQKYGNSRKGGGGTRQGSFHLGW